MRLRNLSGRGRPVIGVLTLAVTVLVVAAGQSVAGTSGPGSNTTPVSDLTAPGSGVVGYVPPELTVQRSFPAQTNTVADFTYVGTADAKITPRTDQGLRSALATFLTPLARVRCYGFRSANPSSDHGRGKACDFMQEYQSAAGVARGWKLANWFVANQSRLGINYVIWQNKTWGSWSPDAWVPYTSSAYGCPNPANITGCHMDHVHVSFY